MQSIIWKALIGVAFTGGLMALGAGVAYADNTTSGDDGTGSGSQAVLGLNLPITVGGNAISVLGNSSSSGSSTTPPASGSAAGGNTNGNASLLGGTQALASAHAPVTIGGNAISVIGDSGSASSTVGSGSPSDGSTGASGSGTTSGDHSTLGGTQVLGDSSAPVTLTGNAISVAGDSTSDGSFAGQSAAGSGSTDGESGTSAPTTSGDDAIAGGTQVAPNAVAPVTVTGNAVSVLGDSSSTGASGSNGSTGSGTPGDTGGANAATTDGSTSILGGTQVAPDAVAPVTATGDAISVIGDSTAGGASTGAGAGPIGGVDTGIPAVTTSGVDGILGGSQLAPAAGAPIALGHEAVSVLGDSSTTSGSGGGEVGGVETFAPPTGTALADLSVEALAETGVPVLAGIALGVLLLMAGIGVMSRAAARR